MFLPNRKIFLPLAICTAMGVLGYVGFTVYEAYAPEPSAPQAARPAPGQATDPSGRKPQAPPAAAAKSVETDAPAQVPAPPAPVPGDPNLLKAVIEMDSERIVLEKRLAVDQLRGKLLEEKVKQDKLSGAPPAGRAEAQAPPGTAARAAGAGARSAFPMPGGEPVVIALAGGVHSALEATLSYANGASYDVTRGSVLPGGYKVASISLSGVTVEKDGETETLLLTTNKKAEHAKVSDVEPAGSARREAPADSQAGRPQGK
jgi:type IV pilus biogenesis protein PilP